MTTTINASNSGSGGLVQTADASGILALQTAGTTAVTVDASQNVGVGTASPAAKFHVAGGSGSTIKNTASAGSSWFVGSNVDSYILHNESNTPMVFTTNGTERMRIDSSGNVFVGGTTQNASNKPVYASTTAKAWVNFGGAGTINGSFNVSSVTRTSTGNFEVNFSSAMPNANYAATVSSWQSASNNNVSYNVFSFTTAKYQISTFENSNAVNPNATYSIVFAT